MTGAMFGFGSLFIYTFGVFLEPLTAEFHWSREAVSRGFAIAAMTVAAISPPLGYALDRWGPRRIVIPCFAVFAAALLALSRLSGGIGQLYLILFVTGLAANGTTQMGLGGAVASWFTARRGLAFACVLAGTGIGSIVHPVLAGKLIAAFGWRAAYVTMACLVVLFGIPPVAAWVRLRESGRVATAAAGMTVRGALGRREFWLLAAVLFLSSLAVNGTLAHLAALASDRGMTAAQGALATSILGGANLAGRLAAGWMLDRFFGPRLSLCLLAVMSAGLLLLSHAASFPWVAAAALMIGLGLGGEADVTPYLLTRYFGLRSFSALYGITWTFYAIAGGTGPVIFGRAFDRSGSYATVLLLGAALVLGSALLMLAMRRYPEPSGTA